MHVLGRTVPFPGSQQLFVQCLRSMHKLLRAVTREMWCLGVLHHTGYQTPGLAQLRAPSETCHCKNVMGSEFSQGLGCCAQVGEMERLPPTWDQILLPFLTPPCFDISYINSFLANSISSSFVAFLLLWPPQQHCLKGPAELWDGSWVGGRVEQQQHRAGNIWEQLPSRASTFCWGSGLGAQLGQREA